MVPVHRHTYTWYRVCSEYILLQQDSRRKVQAGSERCRCKTAGSVWSLSQVCSLFLGQRGRRGEVERPVRERRKSQMGEGTGTERDRLSPNGPPMSACLLTVTVKLPCFSFLSVLSQTVFQSIFQTG